jgi:hypothetical protein
MIKDITVPERKKVLYESELPAAIERLAMLRQEQRRAIQATMDQVNAINKMALEIYTKEGESMPHRAVRVQQDRDEVWVEIDTDLALYLPAPSTPDTW